MLVQEIASPAEQGDIGRSTGLKPASQGLARTGWHAITAGFGQTTWAGATDGDATEVERADARSMGMRARQRASGVFRRRENSRHGALRTDGNASDALSIYESIAMCSE